jgi:hypothetical protein
MINWLKHQRAALFSYIYTNKQIKYNCLHLKQKLVLSLAYKQKPAASILLFKENYEMNNIVFIT